MGRLLVLAVMVIAVTGPAATAQAVTLAPGFFDELVTTISAPTALAFTPDGRTLITTKPGTVRVLTAAGSLLATPALNLSTKVCSNRDRGLSGVAVDPAFTVNHYVYLFYTFNKFADACPTSSTTASAVNRVARFVLSDSNVISPATESVLVDNIPSFAGDHNGGDVQFGKDGNLYVSVGDGGCDYAGGGCAAENDASRDENVLLGKILRITPSGGVPPDNPYASDGAAARCNVTGRTDVLTRCKETFARGLRNPFRIAFDPDASGTRFYVNDVGQNTWEEIDKGTAGADYGWNVREGHCATGSLTNCATPPTAMTNPIFDYGHGDGCASITGGAFVPSQAQWPASYAGTYVFGDYVCGKIFQLVPNGSGGFNRVDFATGLGASSAVHLAFGPRGTGKALYYTTFAGGGAVRRIAFATGNRPPTASVTASPAFGSIPLAVAFDGAASSDPDAGDTLTYLWDFADGSPATQTAGPTTSHTYTTAGTYTATLRVRDNHGSVSVPDTVRIDAGNTPPVPSIQSPTSGQAFSVGESIPLRGAATDAQDGTLASSALRWTVIRRHAAHVHPYFEAVGNSSSFVGPAPEDLAATSNSSIEVQLTATDSKGATATVTRIVQPRLANISLDSRPRGLTLALNGVAFTTPRTWTSWVGWNVTLNAPDQAPNLFSSWSDGGARSHVISTPAGGRSATATFLRSVNDSRTGTTSGTFSYAGTWATSMGTTKYMGDDHFSSTTNSSYSFRFSGTQVALYGAKAPHHGQASVQIDAGTAVTIDQYAAVRQDNVLVYRSPTLIAGEHTVKVTVKGTRQAASTGFAISVDRADYVAPPTTVNDARIGTTPDTFSYAGTWATSTASAKYLGDDHYSSTANSSYSFRFWGTQVTLYGAKASHHGQASVQIDAGTAVTIDQYAAVRQDNVLVYRSPILASAAHTVKVTVKGTRQVASTGFTISVDRADAAG